MVVREIVIAGIPKSRTAFSYKASPTVTYSEVPSVKANEEISPSDPSLDGQRDLIMVQELPVGGGFNDVMYADLRKHSFAYWTEPEEPEPETNDDPEPAPGYFTVIANARTWFGEESALDPEGIDEWLYVVTDKKEIRRWVPAPGGGFYETAANIRIWDGLHAQRPAQGIEGWLYIEKDTRLVFIWDGAKYINISGVVDIQVEAALSQSKTPLVIEYEDGETKSVAKLSIKNATAADVGVVKPDGSTITVAADGKLTGTKITAGTAITVSPSTGTGNVTVNNAGVTRINAGTNVAVSANTGAVTVNVPDLGVTQITPGTAITVSPTTGKGNVTVNNAGVTRINAGTNVAVSANTGAVTVNVPDLGVTQITAGTAITVSPTSGKGNVTVTNAGVRSCIAGTGISLNADVGNVTITNANPYYPSTHKDGAFISQPFHPVTGEITFERVLPGKTVKYLLDENITPAGTSGWSVNIFLKDPEQQMTAGTYLAEDNRIGIYLRNDSPDWAQNVMVGYSFFTFVNENRQGKTE